MSALLFVDISECKYRERSMEQHLIMPAHTCVQKTSSRQISHNSHHPIIMINAGEVSLPGVFCINYPKAITAAWSNTGESSGNGRSQAGLSHWHQEQELLTGFNNQKMQLTCQWASFSFYWYGIWQCKNQFLMRKFQWSLSHISGRMTLTNRKRTLNQTVSKQLAAIRQQCGP